MKNADGKTDVIDDVSLLGPGPSDLVKLRLNDPNAYNKVSEWEFDFRQIGAGPPDVCMILRKGRSVEINHAIYSPECHQVGMVPPETINLIVMITPTMKTWRGIELDKPCLLSCGPEQEFEGVNTPNSREINFSVSKHRLSELADCLGLDVPRDILRSAPVWVTHNPSRLNAIIQRASYFVAPPAVHMTGVDEEDLLRDLLIGLNDAREQDDRSSLRIRSPAVEKALACMEDCADEAMPISKICSEIGVSWRSLDRAFLERFGIGPKAYQTRLRMSRARSEIMGKGADCLVSDVANKWGFWHMGKFAQDYKTLFGELPSETRGRRPFLFAE